MSDEIKVLKDIDKWIKSIPDGLYRGPFSFYIEKLEEYKKALFGFSKFKKGEFVVLTKTPTITKEINHGWLGYKSLLVKGTTGKLMK